MGNVITLAEHKEDLALLLEMGANTMLLTHYQHAQAFYDLCDEVGLIVWAEIPYITAQYVKGPSEHPRSDAGAGDPVL